MSTKSIEMNFSEAIVMLNSLVRNIENIRVLIKNEKFDDKIHDLEEELNDYVMLIPRLLERYENLSEKGELPTTIKQKICEIS